MASLEELAAVAAALGLLVAGQAVLLVKRRREVIDAVAAGNARDLEAAVRRSLAGARLAAGAGALAPVAYVGSDAGPASCGRAKAPPQPVGSGRWPERWPRRCRNSWMPCRCRGGCSRPACCAPGRPASGRPRARIVRAR